MCINTLFFMKWAEVASSPSVRARLKIKVAGVPNWRGSKKQSNDKNQVTQCVRDSGNTCAHKAWKLCRSTYGIPTSRTWVFLSSILSHYATRELWWLLWVISKHEVCIRYEPKWVILKLETNIVCQKEWYPWPPGNSSRMTGQPSGWVGDLANYRPGYQVRSRE